MKIASFYPWTKSNTRHSLDALSTTFSSHKYEYPIPSISYHPPTSDTRILFLWVPAKMYSSLTARLNTLPSCLIFCNREGTSWDSLMGTVLSEIFLQLQVRRMTVIFAVTVRNRGIRTFLLERSVCSCKGLYFPIHCHHMRDNNFFKDPEQGQFSPNPKKLRQLADFHVM